MNETSPASPPGVAAAAVEVKSLRREFVTGAEPLVVIDDLDLDLPAGESLSIVGPSGCGKSTLLYILGTLDAPDSGTVRIGEQDPFSLSAGELSQFRNRNIGFVFQDHYLMPQLDVIENVLVPTLASAPGEGPSREELPDRARHLLERVGLSGRLTHFPSELSGGEKQRVALARALIGRPRLLLCDEPTGNLDPDTARKVGDLLLEIRDEESTTLVVVTHSLELAARFSRRARMDRGRLDLET